jgi:hypothetical protein
MRRVHARASDADNQDVVANIGTVNVTHYQQIN